MGDEEEEETHAVLCFVVMRLADDLYEELRQGLRLPLQGVAELYTI